MTRQRLFMLLYVTALLALAALALELGGAYILHAKDQGEDVRSGARHLYHPYRSHQLNPDYLREFDTHGAKVHSVDGFRSDTEYSIDKPADTIRIIMLGGSALYGIGATDPYPQVPTLRNDETISWHLEKMLRERLVAAAPGRRLEVINASAAAYTTWHHLVYINETLLDYRPDLLVFLDGHNDFYHYAPYNNWQDYRGGTEELTSHFDARDAWFTGLTLVRYLARFSNFFMALEKYLQADWPAVDGPRFAQSGRVRDPGPPFPANVDRILDESIFKSYVQIQALGKMFDFDLQVFLQPQLALEDTARLSAADRDLQRITAGIEINPRRAEIRPLFAAQFARHDIEFHDIAEIAAPEYADTQLYIDYCHLTPAGSQRVAARLLEAVWARLEQRLARMRH